MIINRRGFIQGLASLVAAPAVLRVAPIMPVKPVALVEYDILHDAYVEISMGYKTALLQSFSRTKEIVAVRMMEDIQNRLFEGVLLP